MKRILVVTHSADERDAVLWKEVLHRFPDVDLVVPRLIGDSTDTSWLETLIANRRVEVLPAIEPFGNGHSSLWIRGVNSLIRSGRYGLLHAAMEPWALIPQVFVNRIPTVVQGAESVIQEAPWPLRLRRTGLRRVLRHVAGLAAWGQTSVDAFEAAGLPSATPRAVIPMGIPDPDVFQRTPIPSFADGLRILYVGRLDPEKGVTTVIDALNHGETIPTELRIVGSGPEVQTLRALAAKLRSATVTFTGAASRDEVASAMHWAHIVVVPSVVTSTWREQWGRVPVEAILSGRPCLVSDSGELPLISPFPETIFRRGDSSDLSAKLHMLVSTPGALETVARKQYTSVDRFKASHLASILRYLWDQALKVSEPR